MPVKKHTCPNCGQKTKYIHDYRSRKIKDLPAFDQNIILVITVKNDLLKIIVLYLNIVI